MQSGRTLSWEAKAHGAAVRLHDVRGERRNVPRWGAVLYGAEDLLKVSGQQPTV